MRYLRICAVILLVFSLLLAGWANLRYYGSMNTDHPVLTSSEELLELSIQEPPEALLRGLSASDATDGDLTDKIMVASMSHFLEKNTVSVKYVVFDSHNNAATLTRRVHYTDYTPPTFSLDKTPVYTVGSSMDLLKHVKVQDCLDGDLTDRIRVISNMVNNYSVGVYPVILEVSNSCGDTAQMTIWVTYLAKENTANVALHQYIVYHKQGETFDPKQWITSVTDRKNNALDKNKIEVLGNLDVDTPGVYSLAYNYTDGKLAGQSTLTVVVTEGGDSYGG